MVFFYEGALLTWLKIRDRKNVLYLMLGCNLVAEPVVLTLQGQGEGGVICPLQFRDNK
jgi:hypothetical protein